MLRDDVNVPEGALQRVAARDRAGAGERVSDIDNFSRAPPGVYGGEMDQSRVALGHGSAASSGALSSIDRLEEENAGGAEPAFASASCICTRGSARRGIGARKEVLRAMIGKTVSIAPRAIPRATAALDGAKTQPKGMR